MYEKEITALQKIIDESENIVFFGGAGVSTESGIPDFRSEDGLYHEKYSYPPERIKQFSVMGYRFSEDLSSEKEYVFVRKKE